MNQLRRIFAVDWLLLLFVAPLLIFGLVSINTFNPETNGLFNRQLLWISISLAAFFILSTFDFRFLKNSKILTLLYIATSLLLASLFIFGSIFGGAQSWFNLGFLAFQPVDIAKVVLILVLAKFFAKRHIQIADISHILVSGAYAFAIFFLVLVQPDFGSAMIIFFIWFGMVLASGLSWRHLFGLLAAGIVTIGLLWSFVFADYQKTRILTFFNPTADLQGAGYNSNQAKIALGSGELFGKGLGYGTQSRLQFLPEHETDFIFSTFAEEWGFIGVLFLFIFYFLVIARIIYVGSRGESNFEILFAAGVAIYFISHFFVHVGINIGVLPVTGTTLPFMSYGGSHLLAEFTAMGILMGLSRNNRIAHKSATQQEFLGM